jgi:hypothetical protein
MPARTPGGGYTTLKYATQDDSVIVPGYNLLDLGDRYPPAGELKFGRVPASRRSDDGTIVHAIQIFMDRAQRICNGRNPD